MQNRQSKIIGQGVRVETYKGGVKSQFDSPRNHSSSKASLQMSFPTSSINNTFVTAPTSPNPYILRKLNNMDQAQVMKREREDWSRLYHKTLKGIKVMIDVQRMLKDMKKIAGETSTTVMEMEGTILTASINNRTMNATNITQIAEDLWYLVQSDMDERVFQIQRMLVDELDHYKGKGNDYVDSNIKEIQEL